MRHPSIERYFGFLFLALALALASGVSAQEISEFMASNNSTLIDGYGDDPDWIEVYNSTASAIDLSGWYLTDDQGDLQKWPFPAGVLLGSGEHVLVLASSKDEADHIDPSGFIHTTFALSSGGEYLALVMPDGATVVSDYSPVYPPQSGDISYGLMDGKAQFFTTPTPGAPNQADPTSSPSYSRAGGIITEPFELTLTVDDTDAEIHFTLDGSLPTEESELYTAPLEIDTTTHVRARAFRPGVDPSLVVSHSYILLADDLQDFSSNLPLVVVDSLSVPISNTTRRLTYSVFLDTADDGRTRLTDAPDFAGRAGMKIRGFSSQAAPKKQFSLETWDEFDDDKNVSIFGMPSESNWMFHAPYGDKTLMRNHLAYRWWGEMGRYSVRTRMCEMFYNPRGGALSMDDYIGVYVFMEKIKRDKNRVDLDRMTPDDNAEPEISGGYMLKVDVTDPGETKFKTQRAPRLWPWNGFIITEPRKENLTQEQETYIRNYLNDFEAALYSSDFTDPETGYANWIDVDSFIDYFLYTEMLKNGDGFYLSIYYYKERGEKLTMGPIWDFNVCLGNDLDWDTWDPPGWLHEDSGSFWFERLFQDPQALEQQRLRWREWRSDLFTTEKMLADIDEVAALLEEAQQRNFERWPILGKRVQPGQVNPRGYQDRDTYEKEVNWMREWITDRLAWLDAVYLEAPRFDVEGPRVDPGTELTILNPNGEGEIFYTLNGPDPRLSDGGIAPEALPYQDPIVLDDNVIVRARVRVGGTWTDLAEATYAVNVPPLTITEIMYNPADGNDFEFVELFNFGEEDVELGSIILSSAIDFSFSESSVQTLAPGEYVLVVSDPEAFTNRYGDDLNIAGSFVGRLNNGAETIQVETALEGVPDVNVAFVSIRYDDDWYPVTDGNGPSLVRIDPYSPPETWGEPTSWQPSLVAGGTPGTNDTGASLGRQVAGDGNQDSVLDLADSVFLLGYTFLGTADRLPCGDGGRLEEANLALLDTNGDSTLDATDAVYNLTYLFLDGSPPVQGSGCLEIADCPEVCSP